MKINQLERSLKRNIYLLFVLGAVISAILGTVIYRSDIANRLDSISTQHQQIIAQSQLLWGQHIGDMNHTIELLYQLPELNSALSSQRPVNIDLMQKVFASFINSVDSLMQVRWLDAQGVERVRLDMIQDMAVIVGPEKLQDKGDRYYFTQGMNAGEGQVFLSAIDLNIENGQIELPYRPTLRITIRTGAATGLHSGLLVLNYDVGKLIEMIDTFDSDLVQLLIVQQSGFWVKHSRPDYEWGKDLNHQEYSIKRQAPQLWQHIKQKTSASLIPSPFGLVSYQCSGITPNQFRGTIKNLSLCFMPSTPKSSVSQLRVRSLLLAISVSGVILLFGFGILKREWRMRLKLLQLYRVQERDKKLIEENAQYSQDLLQQQQLLQDDLVESRKLSALGMMVAGVAHELNTPVGSAIMTTSRLQKNTQDLMEAVEKGLTKTALQQYLESNVTGLALVEQSQRRAAKLIRSFKRLAIDRAREDVVQFDLKQVVDDLMLTLDPRFKHSRIERIIDVDKITMIGKPGIISQVLQNLIINALHHAFSDNVEGRLTLSGKLQGDNDMVEIRVIDNGAGVEQQILANIFEPFITSSRAKGNTGLGMHFVHQWVTTSLDGSISIDSEVGQGTRFTIQIPRYLSQTSSE